MFRESCLGFPPLQRKKAVIAFCEMSVYPGCTVRWHFPLCISCADWDVLLNNVHNAGSLHICGATKDGLCTFSLGRWERRRCDEGSSRWKYPSCISQLTDVILHYLCQVQQLSLSLPLLSAVQLVLISLF